MHLVHSGRHVGRLLQVIIFYKRSGKVLEKYEPNVGFGLELPPRPRAELLALPNFFHIKYHIPRSLLKCSKKVVTAVKHVQFIIDAGQS